MHPRSAKGYQRSHHTAWKESSYLNYNPLLEGIISWQST